MKRESRHLPATAILAAIALFYLQPSSITAQDALRIDFNPDNGRSDVRTPSAFNWPIATCLNSQQSLHGVSVTLRAGGTEAAQLTFGWWKAGYDSGATFCSDGVTTLAAGDSVEIVFSGLTPGPHTLTTWHNVWEGQGPRPAVMIDWRTGNESASYRPWNSQPELVYPSHRVLHDELAMTAFTRVVAQPDQEVVVRFRPTSTEQRVVLNGLAWDQPDPSYQTRVHWPEDDDEHVPPNPKLAWQKPRLAASRQTNLADTESASRKPPPYQDVTRSGITYHVYLGTDQQRVRQATGSDPEYLGTTSESSWPVAADDFMSEYFWRIDNQPADGPIIPGQVRRFRIRQLAFPGAEGYGRFAMGGRGGRVIEVSNLEDAGPGSLREAVEASGARTVVFRVGGTIQLKSKLLIRNPYVTIAGQTAPGGGICVRGYTFGCFGTHDVIMRHIRIRVGDEAGATMDGTGFASSDHCIFDHCSISWSIDEAVSSRSAKNITFQRCIVAEALNVANHRKYEAGKGHSFAGSISGDIGSFHHNLLAHCAGRNWSLAGGLDRGGHFAGRLDIRNNVVYNWEHRTNDGGVKALNLVNNLYLPGPATRVFHLLKPDVGTPHDRQQYYVAGNFMEGRFEADADNWQNAVVVDVNEVQAIRLASPFCPSEVTTHSVDELLDNVLNDVGANRPELDPVDLRILANVRQRDSSFQGSRTGLAGIIDSQRDVGGWPQLRSGVAPVDADHDGLPDAWEVAHGLDPHHSDQNTRLSPLAVTALETYLSEMSTIPERQ